VALTVAVVATSDAQGTSSTTAASYLISTAAGSDWVGDGGAAAAAILLQAQGIASDLNGNLYVSDAADHRVRKVSPQGIISTVAGTGVQGFSGDGGAATAAQLNSPYGLAFGRGSLYISDLGNARVRRISPDGTISTVAGGGSLPAGGDNEGTAATLVALAAPRNVALDLTGNLYISDFLGQRVYRMSTIGSLTTVAGTGIRGYSGDFTAAFTAQVNYPSALAIDGQGALYIADSQNHLIRKVSNGVISSYASAVTPTGLVFDGAGTLYVADAGAGQILRFPSNGAAQPLNPTALNIDASDLAFGADGNLYAVAGAVVERISPSNPVSAYQISIVAGGGNLAFGDGGPATQARFNHPSGIAADAAGNFYIADRDNNRIRRVAADGTVTTIAGTGALNTVTAGDTGDNGLATAALLNAPSAVFVDASGALYIADTGNHRVRRVTPAGVIQAAAGTAAAGATGDPGPGFPAELNSPGGVVADAAGNIYVADTGDGKISVVSGAGVLIATLLEGLQGPRGLALDGAGNLYFTEEDGRRVRRLTLSTGGLADVAPGIWNIPRGIAVDSDGAVFVADTGLQRILRVDPAGTVTIVAGNGTAGFAGDGGAAVAAELGFPWDVAIGPSGVLYIADLNNNRVRQLTPGPASEVAPVSIVAALNAASLLPGPVAPGMQLSLQGTGLTAADTTSAVVLFSDADASQPNAQSTPVTGIPATILNIDATQVLIQVPPQVAADGSVQIQILNRGVLLGQLTEAVTGAAPGLYASAPGQAAAINQDGTINSPANPAPRGSVISLWGTGQGVANLPVSVSIGGYTAEVQYAGAAAAYPGLFQINVQVPAGFVPTGNLSVVLTVGQASSQPGVSIAVD